MDFPEDGVEFEFLVVLLVDSITLVAGMQPPTKGTIYCAFQSFQDFAC